MNKKQLNCWIPSATFDALKKRADYLEMKPSTYSSMVLDQWAVNQEPLTPIEKDLARLKPEKK